MGTEMFSGSSISQQAAVEYSSAADYSTAVDYGSAMDHGSNGLLEGFSSLPNIVIVFVIAALLALTATILLCIFVLPENKRQKLNGFFAGIADIFNFKSLLIEKILKFTYVLLTMFAILIGICMLFVVQNGDWMGSYGILIMIAGPIALRLVYEGAMLGILLVKNIIEINKKLMPDKGKSEQPDVQIAIEN